jgi:hypothetical protein
MQKFKETTGLRPVIRQAGLRVSIALNMEYRHNTLSLTFKPARGVEVHVANSEHEDVEADVQVKFDNGSVFETHASAVRSAGVALGRLYGDVNYIKGVNRFDREYPANRQSPEKVNVGMHVDDCMIKGTLMYLLSDMRRAGPEL